MTAQTIGTTGTITSIACAPATLAGAIRVAERTPFEDAVRRAYDANMRYWETVGRATTDYMQAVTRLWADAPLAFTPGARPTQRPGVGEWGDPHAPALLLEGAAGSEARAVVM